MRILFVVPYVPNLIRVRSYQLIRHLHRRGHQVTLATLWSSEREQADLKALQPFCEEVISYPLPRWRSMFNCLAALITPAPLQSAYCWDPALSGALRARFMPENGTDRRAFDVVHVEHLRGVRYGIDLLSAANRQSIPVVWDSVDSITYLFRQAAQHNPRRMLRSLYRFEAARTEQYERHLLNRFSRILVTSLVDRQAFLQNGGPQQNPDHIAVLPNGVDLDYFSPGPEDRREPRTVVISGKMSYHPNIDMALRLVGGIMPLVWQHEPDTKVWIVGKDPPREVSALAEDARVNVTGTVPDLRVYLQQATLAAAPLAYGAGIQNKVLEAMACATPVVASSQSIAGLQAVRPGVDLLTGATAVETAAQIVTLLRDPQLRRRIGCQGRQFVEKYHHWDHIAKLLEEIYIQTNFG